jgi:hypothetical protein
MSAPRRVAKGDHLVKLVARKRTSWIFATIESKESAERPLGGTASVGSFEAKPVSANKIKFLPSWYVTMPGHEFSRE